MKVRDAGVSDFLQVAELDRIGWEANAAAEFIPDGEHAWRVWAEHAKLLVAVDGGALVGFLLSFPTEDPGHYFLHKLLVVADGRGKGVGAELMAAYARWADERRISTTLTTAPSNSRMIALCRRFGFDTGTVVRGYYRPNEDRILAARAPHGRETRAAKSGV